MLFLPYLSDTYNDILANPDITDVKLYADRHTYDLSEIIRFIISAKYVKIFRINYYNIVNEKCQISYNKILDAIAQNTSMEQLGIHMNIGSFQSACNLMERNTTIKEFQILSFSANNIPTILVKNKHRITRLTIDNINIFGYEEFLANNKILIQLDLVCGTNINDMLPYIKNIQILVLRGNSRILNLDCLFKNCSSLTRLHFYTHNFDNDNYLKLIDLLKYNETITNLYTPRTKEFITELVEMFQTNFTLTNFCIKIPEIQAYLDRNILIHKEKRFKKMRSIEIPSDVCLQTED